MMGNKKYKAPEVKGEVEVTLPDESEAPAKAPGEVKAPQTPGRNAGFGITSEFLAGYRTHAYEMRETGSLTSGRLGMEILYLLPDEFVEFYQRLFHRAFSGSEGESVMHGRSGGLDKAAGAQGMVTGSDNKLQASGSGKKWKNTPMFIGNEQALSIKRSIDEGLLGLIADATRAEHRNRVQRALESGSTGSMQSHPADSKTPHANQKTAGVQCSGTLVKRGIGGEVRKMRCGRFLKAGWDFCPHCGTSSNI